MLILSRKTGEKIQIGENVCITVVRVGQGGVRIGVEAPDGYSIVRDEIRRSNEDSSDGQASTSQTSLEVEPF